MKNELSNRLYFGTWQFGGQFRKITQNQIIELLKFAVSIGINHFDTAIVYGKSKIEEILGEILPNNALILTKIPAKTKPPLDVSFATEDYYDFDWIIKNINESRKRLQRNIIDTVLLHNWSRNWKEKSLEPLFILKRFKDDGVIKKIGISLPDSFNTQLDSNVIEIVDVVEAPYNPLDHWILDDLPILLNSGKEVILRSIFIQGLLVKTTNEKKFLSFKDKRREKLLKISGIKTYNIPEILREVRKLNTSIVIGMTTKEQIKHNFNYLKGSE